MVLQLGSGEPVAGPWHVESLAEFVQRLENMIVAPIGRPRIVAIDGRSGSGKTTLAKRIAGAIPTAAVVETDDISWYFSRFDWADRLRAAAKRDGGGPMPRWGSQASERPEGPDAMLREVGCDDRVSSPILGGWQPP